jgi:DMSO/TMAO reductase YedYZ molybdopterin-dependent catalytic subunit
METAMGQGTASRQTDPAPGRMIIRQKKPENLEFPFETLDRFLTPNHQFFIRCHFAQPELDLDTWRLRVEGEVERSLELDFHQLRRMPSRRTTALLECSGNGRVFLVPKAVGVPWELGAVGNAEWSGVPLREVLQSAGVRAGAIEVILEGADSGEPADEPKNPGKISFARSLPLSRALEDDVLLAYEMNGEPLPRAHGFPVRLIVPGWYAMASVKWVTRIRVTNRPFHGYYQTFEYARFQEKEGLPTLEALTEIDPKAQIARPAIREVVPAGKEYRVFGAAWGGSDAIEKVELSTDGGSLWKEATLLDDPVRYAWRFWECRWTPPAGPTRCTLLARATDGRGRVQALERDPRRLNAMISHVLPVEVEVS